MGKRCKVAECPLIKKTAEVPYAGSTRARIVACGESPGRQEEIDGKPFRGQAGKMLRTCCGKAGLEYLQLFLLNAARCRIIKQDLSTKEITAILKYCRPNVEAALKHIKPAAVVALGDFALRQLTRKAGITKARGRWSWSEEFDCWVMPTFHPAYILRNPSMEPYLVEDLRKVSEFVQNGYDVPGKQEGLVYQDVEDLRDWVKEGDLISIDTETQGLRWTEDSFVPIAVSLSRAQGVAFNLDLYEEVPEDQAEIVFPWMRQVGKVSQETLVGVRCCPNFEKRLDGLDWVLRNPKIPKYMMHGAFDMHVLRVLFQRAGREEVPIASYKMDVQAAANVFDENLFKMASLEQLQQFFSDFQENYNQEFEKTYGKADMLAVPQAERSLYACKDADATRRAAMSLREWLMQRPKLARYYAKMVHQSLTLSLYQLEKNGAWIDREELPKVTKVVKEAMEAAHTAALKVMPKSIVTNPFHVTKGFKLTRDDLVRDVLFSTEGFGLDPKRITASKQPSVDKNVRKELLEGRIAKRPREFLTHFNLWQELHTLWSRYLKGFARDVRQDGRIHSSYSLATAVTGRVASRDPNMMNNPKRSASAVLIRRLIAAPKGWVLLAADQSQSELRWAAHVARAKAMIKVFTDGRDIHENTARGMVSNWDKMTDQDRKEARRNAKPVNFGMLYLMTAQGLVDYAHMEYGVNMTEAQATKYIEAWFGTYPELRRYHQETIEFGRKHGYVESPLGRRRRLPELRSDDKWLRLGAERMAVNHPIQSPSSDVVLMACNEMLAQEVLPPDAAFPILFVHDELGFQVRDDSRVEDHARVIKQFMENPPLKRDFGFDLLVPLVSDVKVGPNLGNMEVLNL